MASLQRGFLTGDEIAARKPFAEGTYDSDHLSSRGAQGRIMYDLRLGSEVYLSTKDVPLELTEENPYLIIKPGEFALLTTEEVLMMPNDLVGFLSLRFTWASRGLINISGFHVDPGYQGKIVFSVYNAGPNDVTMRFKDHVFMVFFAHLTQPVQKPYGPGYAHIPLDKIDAVKGVPLSLRDLHNRVTTLETLVKLLVALMVSIVGALVVFFVKP